MTVVDLHHHWIPEEHVTNIDRLVRAGDVVKDVELSDGQTARRVMREGMRLITLEDAMYDVEERLERMDAAGVDVALLTGAAWTNWLDTQAMAEEYNDLLYDVVSEHPDRFVGAAHVPIGTGEAPAELERCVDDLGFRALNITTHAHRYLPDQELYFPLYEIAEAEDIPVFVHIAHRPPIDVGMHEYDMHRTVGRPFAHHLVVARLLRSDVFERFPDLQFIHGHLGGTFMPSTFRYGSGGDSLESRTIATDDDFVLTPEQFESRMDNNLFTTTFWNQPGIQYATETLGTQRMALGTDYPIREEIIAEVSDALDGLDVTADELAAIKGDNAARFLDV